MTIILTGGGSGGHITPILAVADALKARQPDCRVVYIGQTGDQMADIPRNHEQIDEVYTIRAGKFRRYHGSSWRHLFDLKSWYLNFRDFWRFLGGIRQARKLLKQLKPAVIFTPGGYVGVPVGIAAHRLKIPLVTHDLDIIPSWSNRINARWAAVHAVALPVENFSYPKDKTVYVGVPVSDQFRKVTPALQLDYRKGLGIAKASRVVCVTGGGLGAVRLNRAVMGIAEQLMEHYPGLVLLHVAGRKHQEEVSNYYNTKLKPEFRQQVLVRGFVSDMYRYSAAADVVVTRAGATALAEFALQGRPCVVVPNAQLTGGHQSQNARVLAEAGAIKLVEEADGSKYGPQLYLALKELLDSSDRRTALSAKLAKFAKPKAADSLAELLLKYK